MSKDFFDSIKNEFKKQIQMPLNKIKILKRIVIEFTFSEKHLPYKFYVESPLIVPSDGDMIDIRYEDFITDWEIVAILHNDKTINGCKVAVVDRIIYRNEVTQINIILTPELEY